MFDSKTINDISNNIKSALPGLNTFKEDTEKNLHAFLQTALGKLDLVSREEFEVQKAVLAKTRAKLEALEKRVASMEQQVLDDTEL
jgi:BMFP domain-containing protein YqiC